MFHKSGKTECDTCSKFIRMILGGDKGYRNTQTLGGEGMMALTMTAETEEAPDDVAATQATPRKPKRQWRKESFHLLDARFSHYRSVVERVIGYLKDSFAFLRGPIFASQQNQLTDILRIACALSNRNVARNPRHFFKGN